MENNIITNLVLPAVAIRGFYPLPNTSFKVEIGRESSVLALEEAVNMYDGNLLLLIQKDPKSESLNPDDLHPIGLLAKVQLKLKLPNGHYKVKFKISSRILVRSFESLSPYFVVNYEKLQSNATGSEKEKILLKKLSEYLKSEGPDILTDFSEVQNQLKSAEDPSVIADIFANNLIECMDRYFYIQETVVENRLEKIVSDIEAQKMSKQLEAKINEEVRKSIDQSQKEYFLREKMRAIQNELGDKARQEEEIEEFRKKINSIGLPEGMKKKALKELERYSNTSNMMPESNTIRNYLELVCQLPWNKSSQDNEDLVKVKEILDKNHYGLDKIKERILEYLAVKIKTKQNPTTIICFAGPPGVGKTSLAKSIAEALGRKFIKQSVGGVRDESEIRGHRRTYVASLPGRIIKGMADAGYNNPVFLIDEIDKMTTDYRGDPAAAMLEVLDPEQNKMFSDNYLEEPYDLSQVMFITTANDISKIPDPLRDRMEIIELSSYTEYEKLNIANKHLLPRELKAHGLDGSELDIPEETMRKIIQGYTREAGVRELNRLVGTICRKTIKNMLIDKVEHTTVTLDNLEDFLGKVRFFNNEGRTEGQVGIVTGLAYTQFGGDTLDIEVSTYPGKGAIILTGKLGDVMKESAQAALSYVKAHAKELGVTLDLANTDIHIHVPEGAVPKDGPSAGVTLTTALTSALSGKKVPSTIGMTGEITLRGQVLPIGGLREKSIAAVRSGLKHIFIPFENERDLDEVPKEVKAVLEITPVKHISELLAQVFE